MTRTYHTQYSLPHWDYKRALDLPFYHLIDFPSQSFSIVFHGNSKFPLNPLVCGARQQVTHSEINLHCSAATLFKDVSPFSGYHAVNC